MRSKTFSIALKLGILQHTKGRRMPDQMESIENLVCRSYGMAAFDAPTSVIASGTWPEPYLFRLNIGTFHISGTTLSSVDESDWSLTPITTYDIMNPGTVKAITADGPWHFVDFKDFIALTNDSCLLVYDNSEAMQGRDNKWFVFDEFDISSCCAIPEKGRIFWGGFSTYGITEDLKSLILNTAAKNNPFDPLENGFQSGEFSNFILVSGIGDNALWFLDSRRSIQGVDSNYKAPVSDGIINDLIDESLIAIVYLPFRGNVQAVLPLGDNFIVAYGDNAVFMLTMHSSGVIGATQMMELPGISSRNTVAGDRRGHTFLGSNNELYRIFADGKIERLDYKHIFSTMSDPIFVRDPIENEIYISNSTTSYVLSSLGLSSVGNAPASLILKDGDTVGIVKDLAFTKTSFITDVLDFGVPATKTITALRLNHDGFSNVEYKVYYRFAKTDAYSESGWIRTGDSSSALVMHNGIDFKIGLRADASTDAVMESLEIELQIDDYRYYRSQQYASQD